MIVFYSEHNQRLKWNWPLFHAENSRMPQVPQRHQQHTRKRTQGSLGYEQRCCFLFLMMVALCICWYKNNVTGSALLNFLKSWFGIGEQPELETCITTNLRLCSKTLKHRCFTLNICSKCSLPDHAAFLNAFFWLIFMHTQNLETITFHPILKCFKKKKKKKQVNMIKVYSFNAYFCATLHILPLPSVGSVRIFFFFDVLKEVSYAHQHCIYSNKNTIKTLIF